MCLRWPCAKIKEISDSVINLQSIIHNNTCRSISHSHLGASTSAVRALLLNLNFSSGDLRVSRQRSETAIWRRLKKKNFCCGFLRADPGLRQPRLFSELPNRAKASRSGTWSRPSSVWLSSRDPACRLENVPEGQPSLITPSGRASRRSVQKEASPHR